GDGAAWLHPPPQARWRPQEGLCPAHGERAATAHSSVAAGRGRKPNRRTGPKACRRCHDAPRAAVSHREPGLRRTGGRYAHAVDPGIGATEGGRAEAPVAQTDSAGAGQLSVLLTQLAEQARELGPAPKITDRPT